MEILKAILFGIVEGVTEWLPISSTGHLILLNEWVKFNLDPAREAAFMEFYDIVIQLAAILAVVVIYWKVLWPFGIAKKGLAKPDAAAKSSKKKNRDEQVWKLFGNVVVKQKIFWMWVKIVIACIPGVLYGLLLDEPVEKVTAPYKAIIVAVMLILVGILFIIIETKHKGVRPKIKTIPDLTWQIALAIGFCQLIAAALPGTSRSGATIIAGLMLGLSRQVAANFTFFLAIPTMAGASLVKLLKFLGKGMTFTGPEITILIVTSVTAFLVSLVAIQFLTLYIGKNKDFKPFGWYRIVLGALVLLYFIVLK
ncbi:MAG: undecaprenyl-diphosphate phosphatase [Lachnospiraceae bacterium]|nr:undecaprenyl-diphosphate phosphatase [Lachnospiraceae bacterium]MBO6208917.1 undecaprenyl-diphosphate phosphatase [Lachnospiraceae bacterium]